MLNTMTNAWIIYKCFKTQKNGKAKKGPFARDIDTAMEYVYTDFESLEDDWVYFESIKNINGDYMPH